MPFYALILDANGLPIGSHVYGDEPSSLPANEVACTQEQAQNPVAYKVQGGQVAVAPPTLSDQANAMLEAGIQVVSAGTPDLSGTYACDPVTLSRAGNLLAAIAAGLTIPGGVIPWADINGAPHSFTPDQFKSFSGALLAFEMQLAPLSAGAPGSLPTLPVTIP
jgi:hypothetical protein